ncbi:hypothetical protein KIPB_013821, partial [Kipferlia bialata]
ACVSTKECFSFLSGPGSTGTTWTVRAGTVSAPFPLIVGTMHKTMSILGR